MSVSFVDGDAVSGMRIDTGVLSAAAFASGGSVQAESALHVDRAVYRLRISRLHEECNHRTAATPTLCSFFLPLGVARADDFLLGVSQHALVSVCIVKFVLVV